MAPNSYHDYARITGDATVPIIDDFEDGDVSEYTMPSDDTGYIIAQTGTVRSGTYAGQIGGVNDNQANAYSTSGLDNYPQSGDTIEYYSQMTRDSSEGDQTIFKFAHTRTGTGTGDYEGYRITFGARGNELAIWRNDGGSFAKLSSSNYTVTETNEWLRFVIGWKTDGSITTTVYDSSNTKLVSTTTVDSTYKSGGIALASTGVGYEQKVFFDDISII